MSGLPDGPVEILLVEDTAADAELTIRALRKANLAERLLWVKDGQEAIDFLYGPDGGHGPRGPRPRVILLDLKLPKLDGSDVLRHIKADEHLRAIPVVMLTSSSEERDIVATYQLGVNSYLVKPVEFQELAQQVVAACRYWLHANRVPA